jgi:amicyanin
MRLMLAGLLVVLSAVFVSPPAAQAASQSVTMMNYAYSPSTLMITVGDTVTWTNHDQAPHDVVTTSAPVAIKSPLLNNGQSFTYTFTTAGTYSYYCSVHPDMTAKVIVQPAAAAPAPVVTQPKTSAQPKATTSRVPPTQQPVMSMPASSVPALVVPESSVPPTVNQAQPAVAAASTTTSLDPMLLVAGVAAGVAVLCLLLLSSRPSRE